MGDIISTCGLHLGVGGRAAENKVCQLGSFSNGYEQQENQTVGYCSEALVKGMEVIELWE